MALTLQRGKRRVCQIAKVSNVRTEIVLSDGRDVAFWFSTAFRLMTFNDAGKLVFPLIHQTLVRPKTLFPKRPEYGEKLKSVEDESTNKDSSG